MTRSVTDVSASGFIDEHAIHWSIESHIPIEASALIDHLASRDELSGEALNAFREHCQSIESVLDQRAGSYHTRFSRLYCPVDPDFDGKVPNGAVPDDDDSTTQQLMDLCDELLATASYRRLSHEEIEQCVGVTSQFGIRLHVDFDQFKHLAVYARGDIVGTRMCRRLQRLYLVEQIEVPIYQRMVVIFQLRDDADAFEELSADKLHLRKFKNIPKADVEMLLPGVRVRLSKIDRAKIIVPSLGGFLLSLRKIFQFVVIVAALTLYKAAILVGLVFVAIGYIVKSVMSYFQTKDKHLLKLTRNLYFQKLDTNAGVGYRIVQQARTQSMSECALALYAIMTNDGPVSRRKLRRRCERMIREAVDVEVDFNVDRALELLNEQKIVSEDEQGRWQWCRRDSVADL